MDIRPGATTPARVLTMQRSAVDDLLATEEPLEIRLVRDGSSKTVAVTMRTPGADFELAVGFLYSEGVLASRQQVRKVSYCVDVPAEQHFNVVNVEMDARDFGTDLSVLDRHFLINSACGVCGKASLDALRSRGYGTVPEGPVLSGDLIGALPDRMRAAQKVFAATGGAHAAGLFTPAGDLLGVREDVGRHNALDKLIGWAFLQDRLPLSGHILMVSGRASFELVQKTLASGAAALCSVSAPSSLAVQLAREFGLALAGFVRPGGYKLYSGEDRVAPASPPHV